MLFPRSESQAKSIPSPQYSAVKLGEHGSGGEYAVQDGFGWSNGVALWIFKEFADNITLTGPTV